MILSACTPLGCQYLALSWVKQGLKDPIPYAHQHPPRVTHHLADVGEYGKPEPLGSGGRVLWRQRHSLEQLKEIVSHHLEP